MPKKKNVASNDNELICKVIDLGLIYCIKQSQLHIAALEEKTTFLDNMKEITMKNEPLKIFKKAHQRWDCEIDEYNRQLRKAYADIEFEEKEIKEILNNMGGENNEKN